MYNLNRIAADNLHGAIVALPKVFQHFVSDQGKIVRQNTQITDANNYNVFIDVFIVLYIVLFSGNIWLFVFVCMPIAHDAI